MADAYEVSRQKAEAFYDIAASLRAADPLRAAAVEISGDIASARHYALGLALDRAATPHNIASHVSIDIAHAADKIDEIIDQCGPEQSVSFTTRLKLQRGFLSNMVLGPALLTYPAGNSEANARHTRPPSQQALTIARILRDTAPHDNANVQAGIRDATLLALSNRQRENTWQLLPALMGEPGAAQAELFTQGPRDQLQHTFVRTAFTVFETQVVPGVVDIGDRHLGHSPHTEPWDTGKPYPTIQALIHEARNNWGQDEENHETIALDTLEATVNARIRASIEDYKQEAALQLPSYK